MRRVIKRWSNSPSSFHPEGRATSGGSSNLFQGWRGDVTTPNADIGQVSQLEGEGVWLPGPFPAGMFPALEEELEPSCRGWAADSF